MAEQQTPRHRPSFTSFWKRSKDPSEAKKITFVQNQTAALGAPGSSSGGVDNNNDGANAGLTAEEKSKVRRAQVRKAQIQHRQRKANYVKQLEIDIARIREMIAVTQRETHALKGENDAMRAHIQRAVGQLVQPQSTKAMPATTTTTTTAPSQIAALGPQFTPLDSFMDVDSGLGVINMGGFVDVIPELQSTIELNHLDDVTVSLALDSAMNTPTYQISSSPSASHYGSSPMSNLSYHIGTSVALPEMSPDQMQQAINFILALEHCCWDHFTQSDFEPATEPVGDENGHTFMATSLALRAAPATAFDTVTQTAQNIAARSSSKSRSLSLGSSSTSSDQHPQKHAHQHLPPVIPNTADATTSWPASGLTLQNLYDLANGVNPPDTSDELTPVQAWFELAATYPLALLLRPDVMANLKREMDGVVKCVRYGAAMERQAFESVVGRVLDPELARMQGFAGVGFPTSGWPLPE